jgi:hypothetical protein
MVYSKPPEPSRFLIPKVIVGGAFGLLAGYGLLAIFKGWDVAPKPQPTKEIVQEKPAEPPARPRVQYIPERVPARQITQQPIIEPLPESPPRTAPKPLRQRPVAKVAEPVKEKPLATDSHKPSAIITLSLDKSVIRAVAEVESNQTVLCDVSFSRNLVDRSSLAGYSVVAEKLASHRKETIELPANIKGAGAAIEITVLRRNNLAICELRPLLSLPSGSIQPLTVTRGTKLYNDLSKSSAAYKSASRSLPNMQSSLVTLQASLQSAQRAKSGTGNTPAETGNGQITAVRASFSLSNQIRALQKQIANAQKLIDQGPDVNRDLDAMDLIGKYAKEIAAVSTVSVRFYSGDVTIPATVK